MDLRRIVVPAPEPVGELTLGVTASGLALLAFRAGPDAAVRAAERLGVPLVDGDPDHPAAVQVRAYLAGDRRVFDMPLDWSLTAGAQRRVLAALHETVPFGATATYGELAVAGGLGREYTAARGVGAIMGSNPIAVVVPCHRVLAADGLGGFGGGRATKEWLLAHEGVLTAALDFG
jgi:methylated-DNA-[protein]-cysteine S-methyltransferase